MNINLTTVKYAAALVCIVGAAAGLNLGVLELTDPPTQDAVQQVQLTGSEAAAQGPQEVVVDVPVVVPDGVLEGQVASADPAAPVNPDLASEASGTSPLSSPEGAVAGTSTSKTAALDPTVATETTQAPATTTTADTTTTTAPASSTTRAPATAASKSAESTSTTSTTTTKAPAATSAPASTEYLYYEFPGVASQIVIAQHGDGSLEFWSVTPEPGWRYAVEAESSREIDIEFERGDDEAEFKVQIEDGRLKVSKELDND